MKNSNFKKMNLFPEELLDRTQLATIIGGTFYNCTCNGGEPFTVMTDGDPVDDSGCPIDQDVSCVEA